MKVKFRGKTLNIDCAEDVYQRDSVNEECVELVGILKGIKQQGLFKINKVVQY